MYDARAMVESPPTEGERILAALRDVARSQPVALTVRGGSMEPGIVPGARLEVRRQRVYLPGDVLVFADAAGVLTVHRLLGPLPRRRLLMRGDAAPGPDAGVPLERVVGRVVGGACGPEVQRPGFLRRTMALSRWAFHVLARLGRRRASPR